jgi:hypothetical protein
MCRLTLPNTRSGSPEESQLTSGSLPTFCRQLREFHCHTFGKSPPEHVNLPLTSGPARLMGLLRPGYLLLIQLKQPEFNQANDELFCSRFGVWVLRQQADQLSDCRHFVDRRRANISSTMVDTLGASVAQSIFILRAGPSLIDSSSSELLRQSRQRRRNYFTDLKITAAPLGQVIGG